MRNVPEKIKETFFETFFFTHKLTYTIYTVFNTQFKFQFYLRGRMFFGLKRCLLKRLEKISLKVRGKKLSDWLLILPITLEHINQNIIQKRLTTSFHSLKKKNKEK